MSMTSVISFLVSRRFSSENGTARCRGRISDSNMRPGVVATTWVTISPVLSMVVMRDLILVCSVTVLTSRA